jgi:hypothetical protein
MGEGTKPFARHLLLLVYEVLRNTIDSGSQSVSQGRKRGQGEI